MTAQGFGVIQGGVCTNVISLDPDETNPEEFAPLIGADVLLPIAAYNGGGWGIGALWDGQTITVPPPPAPPETDPNTPAPEPEPTTDERIEAKLDELLDLVRALAANQTGGETPTDPADPGTDEPTDPPADPGTEEPTDPSTEEPTEEPSTPARSTTKRR